LLLLITMASAIRFCHHHQPSPGRMWRNVSRFKSLANAIIKGIISFGVQISRVYLGKDERSE
jgi:hypothetical protein